MATFRPEHKDGADRASHDTVNPPALLEFMMQRWKPAAKKLPAKVRGWQSFAARRRALSKAFPGETLIVPTGHEKVRANDTSYRFRPGSDFYYLTGNLEPDCVLVLVPNSGGHDHVLFVEPNPGRTNHTFFTDRVKGELWVGPRLGVAESAHRYQVDRGAALSELPAVLNALGSAKVRVLRGYSPDIDARVPELEKRDRELATFLSEQRLIKDDMEVEALVRACQSTRRGFEDVIRTLKKAVSEREVEGVFNLRARVEGNDVGYGTIAAAGAHACILHWTRNDGAIDKRELLLLDAGVEGNELYTADVTRTIPISGKFGKEQRQIYELVLEAQAKAFAEVKPGNDFMAPNRAAMMVLAYGLEHLGILPTSAEEALRDQNQFYKRYTLHNVSHMLGLDVHDCAQARQEAYKYGTLQPGMVLTVEPGLYFQLDDLTVPAKYRGIGVRIEDDVVVTKKGYRIISDLPRTVPEVERWMREVWKRK
jgi:Xaa-Pro aminopeptidase